MEPINWRRFPSFPELDFSLTLLEYAAVGEICNRELLLLTFILIAERQILILFNYNITLL